MYIGKIGNIVKASEKYIQIDGKNTEQYSFKKEVDNIMYSTAFRQMSAKTQVFNSVTSDYLRTPDCNRIQWFTQGRDNITPDFH